MMEATRSECQGVVYPHHIRVGVLLGPARPVEQQKLRGLCFRNVDRPSLFSRPQSATASHREHGPLWMTVDMWTTCGRFLRGVARGTSQGSCDVSEPAECPPSPPERDALVRRAMLLGVEAVSKINYTTT